MSSTTSLDRVAFKRGVNAVLTLKPLREAAGCVFSRESKPHIDAGSTVSRSVSVTVERTARASWHVKRAS